jgi:hypothetical protein
MRKSSNVNHTQIRVRPISYAAESFELHELAALVGLVLLPVFGYAVAFIMRAPLMHRYSLSAVAGFVCLFGVAAARKNGTGLIVLALLLMQIVTDFALFRNRSSIEEPGAFIPLSTSRAEFNERYQWMAADPHHELPVVVLDNLEFAQTLYYAPHGLVPRLIYLQLGVTEALYHRAQESCNMPGTLLSFDALLQKGAWLAYGPSRPTPGAPSANAVLSGWMRAGVSIQVERIDTDHGLFLVTYSPPHSGAPNLNGSSRGSN